MPLHSPSCDAAMSLPITRTSNRKGTGAAAFVAFLPRVPITVRSKRLYALQIRPPGSESAKLSVKSDGVRRRWSGDVSPTSPVAALLGDR